jgi:hypothetical protein
MALARIITRSQACSRELALDLLARGYAVEIVSPDAIPDNIADLELRVDAGPGDQVTATVEAHGRDHSSSLDFVHHLKSPMVDFKRRPPEPRQASRFSDVPVSFDAEQSLEDVEMPAEVSQSAAIDAEVGIDVVVADGIFVDHFPEIEIEENERLIEPSEPLVSQPKSPVHLAPEALAQRESPAKPTFEPSVEPGVLSPSDTPDTPQWRDRPAGWFWRVGVACVSIVALVLLGFGFLQNGKAAARVSGQNSNSEDVAGKAAPENASLAPPGKEIARVSPPSPSSPVTKPQPALADTQQSSTIVVPPATVASIVASTAVASTAIASTAKSPRKHDEDLIAPNTVTYLDKRFAPAPSSRRLAKTKPKTKTTSTRHAANRHTSPHSHHGSVVAANKVTYLNQKPVPKSDKQDSAHSDLN